MPGNTGYMLLLAVSMAITLGVGIYAFKRAAGPAVHFFWMITAFESLWTLGNMLEMSSGTLGWKLFWDNFQWIPTAALPPLLVAFGLRFTGNRLRSERRFWRVIIPLAVVMVLLAWTDSWHGLMRENPRLDSTGGEAGLSYGFHPLHHLANAFVLGQCVAGLGIIFLYFLKAPRLYRAQIGVILIGASAPFVAAFMVVLDLDLGFQRDMIPFSFIALNLCIGWGLFGVRLFDIVPLAREMVIENLADPVLVLDGEDRILDINPALRPLLGEAAGDPVGRSAWEVFTRWPALLERFRGGASPDGDLSVEENGRTHWFNIRVMPLTSQAGAVIGRIVIARNITRHKLDEFELRKHRDHLEALVGARTAELAAANDRLRGEMAEREKIEQQLRQGQKMEALGRLAGGVAHDLNNMLVPILNYTQLVMMQLDPADRAQAQLTQVLRAAERATDLARQILAFSRRQVLQLAPLDLNSVVADLEGMLRRLIGADIRFVVERQAGAAVAMADRSQLDQIMFNLVVNARDAMPAGGTLSVCVGELEVTGAEAVEEWAGGVPKPGRYITLEVNDTGEGIDESVRAQMFDPFFTTKPEGKGTGLGLSTVFGIVKQHGGGLRVRSERGRGSTFTVCFPPTELPAAPQAAASSPTAIPGGTETVLVVDDEATVRAIAVHVLKLRGYQALEAKSPEDACEIARSHAKPIHLLVTDLVMPGINGRDLSGRIRNFRPEIKVLFISGYSNAEMAERGLIGQGEHFLAKPFTVDSLSRKVREVLGSEQGGGPDPLKRPSP